MGTLTPHPQQSLDQRINKGTANFNNTTEQIDLTDIYRTFYLITAEYTLFLSTHGTFSEINHMLGHENKS